MSDDITPPAKLASRPGSMWATGKRINVKGFTQPKGFARGASVKSIPKLKPSTESAK